jgi:hypothetical protein
MNTPWTRLFSVDGSGERMQMRMLRKRGEPLLILPAPARLAVQAMALYPAQTRLARTARALTRCALSMRIPLPLERADLVWSRQNPLAEFVAALSACAGFPPCAILAGNPRPAGRRFVIMPFAADGTPAAIIKAGLDAEARALCAAEADFLASASPRRSGLPTLRARLSQPEFEAFGSDYAPGDSPRAATHGQLGDLLTDWVDTTHTVGVGDISAWRATFENRALPPLLAPLGELRFHPTLFHGDFAPWNIKVHPVTGMWQVLDWERAALAGMPCWDWLHFEIQNAILVHRASAETVLARLERLWKAPPFRDYLQRAGVLGHERALTAAYLQYCTGVLRPTEGLEVIGHLGHLLATR